MAIGGARTTQPFRKAVCEQGGNSNVRVTEGDRTGLFHTDGSWIEGDVGLP